MTRRALVAVLLVGRYSQVDAHDGNRSVCSKGIYQELSCLSSYAPALSYCSNHYPATTKTITVVVTKDGATVTRTASPVTVSAEPTTVTGSTATVTAPAQTTAGPAATVTAPTSTETAATVTETIVTTSTADTSTSTAPANTVTGEPVTITAPSGTLTITQTFYSSTVIDRTSTKTITVTTTITSGLAQKRDLSARTAAAQARSTTTRAPASTTTTSPRDPCKEKYRTLCRLDKDRAWTACSCLTSERPEVTTTSTSSGPEQTIGVTPRTTITPTETVTPTTTITPTDVVTPTVTITPKATVTPTTTVTSTATSTPTTVTTPTITERETSTISPAPATTTVYSTEKTTLYNEFSTTTTTTMTRTVGANNGYKCVPQYQDNGSPRYGNCGTNSAVCGCFELYEDSSRGRCLNSLLVCSRLTRCVTDGQCDAAKGEQCFRTPGCDFPSGLCIAADDARCFTPSPPPGRRMFRRWDEGDAGLEGQGMSGVLRIDGTASF